MALVIGIIRSITFDSLGSYGIENNACELERCLINIDIMVYLQR